MKWENGDGCSGNNNPELGHAARMNEYMNRWEMTGIDLIPPPPYVCVTYSSLLLKTGNDQINGEGCAFVTSTSA